MHLNPYSESQAAEMIKKLRVFISDRDHTFAEVKPPHNGTNEAWENERRARAGIRSLVSSELHVLISQCTPALMMTRAAYLASRSLGYEEPLPKLGITKDGLRTEAAPDTIREYESTLNWPIIAGSGSRIMINHSQAYIEDKDFALRLGIVGTTWSNSPWRMATLKLLDELSLLPYLPPVDQAGMFESGQIDVAPLPGRIQLNFDTIEAKMSAEEKIREHPKGQDLLIIDESTPPTGQIYLFPKGSGKRHLVERILGKLALLSHVALSDLDITIAGDAPPDLEMIEALPEATATFILVGGSRLYPSITDPACEHYAGWPLGHITKHLRPIEHRKGFYTWRNRVLVVGDEAFPGTQGPTTILTYLTQRS